LQALRLSPVPLSPVPCRWPVLFQPERLRPEAVSSGRLPVALR
jgi:hypothetical protein